MEVVEEENMDIQGTMVTAVTKNMQILITTLTSSHLTLIGEMYVNVNFLLLHPFILYRPDTTVLVGRTVADVLLVAEVVLNEVVLVELKEQAGILEDLTPKRCTIFHRISHSDLHIIFISNNVFIPVKPMLNFQSLFIC